MYACKIRAALLTVIAVAVVAAFTAAAAPAGTNCFNPNPYTVAGRACIAQQARQQAAAKKSRIQVAKKHSSSKCPDPLYSRWLRCR